MLFQPTNIIPDVRTGIGFGVVDASSSAGVQVSWQVNGDYPVMTAFRIVIYANNAASTQLYDTGKLTAGCPFSGRTPLGEVDFFSYTIPESALSSAGITNGNEYKMVITQFYETAQYVEDSITQSSASVFLTRSEPSISINYASITTVTAPTHTFVYNFNGSHIETLDWIRYQIQVKNPGAREDIMVYDSGTIYGASTYECTYGKLAPGVQYRIKATGQTTSGISVSTPWMSFTPAVPGAELSGELAVRCAKAHDAVFIDLHEVSDAPGDFAALAVYREQDGNPAWQLIDPYVESYYLWDYGVPNGSGPYRYHVFGVSTKYGTTTPSHVVTGEVVSAYVNPVRAYWSILAINDKYGQYFVQEEYQFANNLSSGSFTNNNEPNVMKNFTAMPTVQLSPANYKSGSLTSLIGRAKDGKYGSDTLALRESLMALSTSQDRLFLKSPKGDVFEIAINGPISAEIQDTINGHPQTITVPWVEIDDTPVSINQYFSEE